MSPANRRMQCLLAVAGIALGGLVGCSDCASSKFANNAEAAPAPGNAGTPAVPPASLPPSFAGMYYDGTTNFPCVWTGTGARTALQAPGATSGFAVSPVASAADGTLYVSGNYVAANGGRIPCYWVGTTCTPLTDGTVNSFALAAAVSGGTVYTAGILSAPAPHDSAPCYWAGTTRVDLTGDIPREGNAAGIAVAADGTVHTAGSYINSSGLSIACVWSGTARSDLGDGVAASTTLGIALSGTTVYTVGACVVDGTPIPCYWTGTTPTPTLLPLPVGGTQGFATCLVVAGGTVYTGGYYTLGPTQIACTWTGTTRTDLTDDSVQTASVMALALSGTTLVAGGTYNVAGSASGDLPCTWTGTTRADLDTVQGDVLSAMAMMAR